ncbi:MAG: tail fiber protein [Phycisphaerales bacterium]|nr:tail fiber protein [Phycisphaerales bacterium]
MPLDPYVGEIMLFAGNFAPRGWVECDGRLLDIATYDLLFNVIGTTYGGDGFDNFAVPDLRGRCIISQGTGLGLSTRVIGQLLGEPSTTLNVNQIPVHTHSVLATSAAADAPTLAQRVPALAESPAYAAFVATNTELAAGAVSSVGGSQPHNNRQPSLALVYCIAVEGNFPSPG